MSDGSKEVMEEIKSLHLQTTGEAITEESILAFCDEIENSTPSDYLRLMKIERDKNEAGLDTLVFDGLLDESVLNEDAGEISQ